MKIKKIGVFLTALFVTTIGRAIDTTYDPATGVITIPEVEINGKVEFVNVKLKANSDGSLAVLSSEEPKASSTVTTYDPATDTVTIPSVAVNGKVEYENVRLGLNSDGTLSVLSTETPILSNPADQQVESSQLKPETMSRALVATDGWNFLGKIGNYDVKYRSFGISSGYVYQFIGTYGTSQLGFGCICANISGTQTWKGMYDSQCSTSAISDNPLDLGDGIMGSYAINGIPIPTGACCRDFPRVNNDRIPIVSCP